MESLHEIKNPIPQNTPYMQPPANGLQELLKNLQGNILQGHRRKHSVHIFLRFQDGKQTEVKQWIKNLALHITTAQQQVTERNAERNHDEKDSAPSLLFKSFFLSASGYEYFGLSFPRTYPLFDDVAFPWGMKRAQEQLNDPPIAYWENGYREEIHAVVLLAHNEENVLLKKRDKLRNEVNEFADILAVEQGEVIRNEQGRSVEHFGFIDSRSHPLFFQSEIDRETNRRGGTNLWNPGVGPNAVLVPDPFGRKDNSNGFVRYLDSGSYVVFRKLEQNVCRFKKYQKKLATELNLTGEERDRAGALIIGRFENGTPSDLHPTPAPHPAALSNNFNYAGDSQGLRCPLHAHIRKVHPRRQDGLKPLIVRRGVTYDERPKESKADPSGKNWPSTGVGILFMCYQKNIRENFEFIQREWASNPDFPQPETGVDPIIGRPKTVEAGEQRWPAKWGEQNQDLKSFSFPEVVTFKGGEYFFAPSIYFLQTMGEG
jgi:Dyp-type peroxidase family